MEKRELLYNTKEAAEYLGLTESQMRNEIVNRKSIKPCLITSKQRVFSKAQLDDWLENGGHTDVEVGRDALLSSAEAAEYLAITTGALLQLFHVLKSVPGETVGHATVYWLADLDEYKASRVPIETPVAVTDVVPLGLRGRVQEKMDVGGLSFYGLVGQLWQEWVDGKRSVPPLLDSPRYRAIPKEGVFARVEEGLKTAVDEQCERLGMKRSYVTAQLLGQWVSEGPVSE